MEYHVVLLNDIKKSLDELVAYFGTINDISLKVVESLEDFEEYMQEHKIHLILANSQCKSIDPLLVCQSIRSSSSLHFLPFLYLSKKDDVKGIKKAYEIGVNECINTPFNLDELLIRMRSHLLSYQTLKKCLVQNERLAVIVSTDSLTKVSNRMHLQTILSQSIKEHKRYERIFSIVYFQINDMQKINTIYGFSKGDKFLKDIAQSVLKSLRDSDIVARWGGGDFIIFLPKSTVQDADLLVKKLNGLLLKEAFLNVFNTRLSYGITQVREEDTIYSLIERANKALLHSIHNRQIYTSFL